FRRAAEVAARRYERAGRPYLAAAARGTAAMREGGVAAINTYDNKIFTFGPGFAGGRLDRMLARLRGTPAEHALDGTLLEGLRVVANPAMRLDVDRIAALVSRVETNDALAREIAVAEISEFCEGSALAAGHAASE